MAIDLTNLKNKIENDGSTSDGVLRAEEFNNLVKAVIDNQQEVKKSIKGITLNRVDYDSVDDRGFLTITTSTGEYDLLVTPEIEPPAVIAAGDSCIFKFSIEHKDLTSGEPKPANFGVTARFYCNGSIVGTITDIYDKEYSGVGSVTKMVEFDYAKATSLSTSTSGNQLYVELDNGLGYTKRSSVYVTKVINMSLKANLSGGIDNELVFTNNNKHSLNATISGGDGYLYVSIDDNIIVSRLPIYKGSPQNIDPSLFNPYNSHGIHILKIWANPIDQEDIIITGPTFRYIYGDMMNNSPIIMSTIADNSTFTEYDNLNVEYIAFSAGSSTTKAVDIYINSVETGKVQLSTTQEVLFNGSVGKGEYQFSLFSTDNKSLVGNSTLNIKIEDFIDTVNIRIISSNVKLESAYGWDVYLTSSGRSNIMPDKNIWKCTNNNGQTYDVAFDNSIEFIEAGSGWNKDVDGNVAMHLRKKKYFTLNYQPFSTNPVYNSGNNSGKGTGKTISIEFATRNCLKQNAPVIECIDPNNGHGFIVYANKVDLISNNQTISCNFKEDERIKLDIVIEGSQILYEYDTVVGKDGTIFKGSGLESLMIIFIDGVYQRLALIPENTTFLQQTPQNIKFGSEYCDLDVYNIRMYNFALDIDKVVKNYAYDTPKFEDKIAIAKRNNIFDNPENNKPNIDIKSLREARPDLPFIYVEMAEDQSALPKDKTNWLSLAKASYQNPNSKDTSTDGNSSWETKYGLFRNQGTSSMNYPWPWRNWDFKLDKYKDENGESQKGYFEIPTLGSGVTTKKWKQYNGMPGGIAKITLKKDYASSEMCNNAICSELFTDMANGIGGTYNVLSPTQNDNGGTTSNYRLTFKATPCFMFHNLQNKEKNGTAGTGVDAMGMMNLIPNKNECEYLGFLKNEWEDGEGSPRSQSWEVSENHIFWDFPIETKLAKNDPEAIEINGKLGYYKKEIDPMLDENGEPMLDENGNVIPKTDENGEPIYIMVYKGNFKNGIDGNYEARYPKDSSIWKDTDFGYTPEDQLDINEKEYNSLINEQADIIEFHNWLVSTNRCLADPNRKLTDDPDYTYESWNINELGNPIYEYDTESYRLEKFKRESPDRLIVDQWLLYYIWREQFWMFDSGAKNLQLYTMGNTNPDNPNADCLQWGCMVRDADTALGIDNVGVDMFPPHLEDIDTYSEVGGSIVFNYGAANNKYTAEDIVGNPVLNGQFGAIWLNLRDTYSSRIAQMYRELVANSEKTHFNSTAAIKRFEDHQSHWCESLYNFGMRQYFGGEPFSAQIDAGNGNKKNSRKSWLEKGFYYRNSKYNNLSDYINVRGRIYKTNDTRGSSLNIKTYIPMYIAGGGSSTSMNAGGANKFRITDPNIGVFVPVASGGLNFTSTSDTNTFVFGSDNITELGDLARFVKFTDVIFPQGGMQKLTELKLGDHTNTYNEVLDDGTIRKLTNESLTSLQCNLLPSLTYLDITRHKVLSTFSFDKCTQLEEFYASGTDSITNLTFPQTTTLRIVHIGGGLISLSMKDLTGIEKFDYDGLSKLQLISINNCGSYLAKNTYNMIVDSINSLEQSYTSGIYSKVCELKGISWKNVDESIMNRLINIDADLTGNIHMNSLSYSTKIKLMTKYGNIDDSNNSLYITYPVISIGDVVLPSNTFLSEIKDYQLTFIPSNKNGNNFLSMKWKLSSNPYATINEDTGVITVTNVGNEVDAPQATITLTIYLMDGSTQEASGTVYFYQRSCKLGDYVFNDGTYNNELIDGKTAIGVCFYIDPTNPNNRLMVAMDDAVPKSAISVNYSKRAWGLYNQNIPDFILDSDPNYNCYDIKKLRNITSSGLIGTDQNPFDNIKDDDDNFIYYDFTTWMGNIGWIECADGSYPEININVENNVEASINIGDKVPVGYYNTLAIIEHRNKILTDKGYKIPSIGVSSQYSELTQIDDLMDKIKEEQGEYYETLYYPAASYCYAYKPTASNLNDEFKEHNWFLPSIGEMIRLTYYALKSNDKLNHYDGKDNIFIPAIKSNKFNNDTISYYYDMCSSTEYNNLYIIKVYPGGPSIATGTKWGMNYIIRPICKF